MPSTIRVTFSDNTINVSLPRGWHELSVSDLKMVYRFLAVYDPEVAPVAIFCRFANAKIIRELDDDNMLVLFRINRKMSVTAEISPDQMASFLSHLDWLAEPGTVPVRLPKIGGNHAVDAQLH
ncbi:MAG: hypothetical protein IJ342_09470, partial [Muribaculaceae bacterium]|nr:hypothetical protein [Muribaculaceae bacterium]